MSRERYSHSSSMRNDSGDASSAALAAAPADDSSMATELSSVLAPGRQPLRAAAPRVSPGLTAPVRTEDRPSSGTALMVC